MNITFEDHYQEQEQVVQSTTEIGARVEVFEPQTVALNEAEAQRWVWTFEKLKKADLGLTFEEKVKIFCEATAPQDIEALIESMDQEQNIIPLAA